MSNNDDENDVSDGDMGHEHTDHESDMSDNIVENSGLMMEVVEKMSGCEHEAVGTIAVALGRMCEIHGADLESVFQMVSDAFEMQQEISEHNEAIEPIIVEDGNGGSSNGGTGAN